MYSRDVGLYFPLFMEDMLQFVNLFLLRLLDTMNFYAPLLFSHSKIIPSLFILLLESVETQRHERERL